MDEFLATVGVQAMRYTIRSAVGLTSTYALKQCSRLLQSIDDKHLHSELRTQQKLLDGKIKVISPALELVEFKSGRGNVFLESAVPLTKALQREIASLGRRIEGIIECGREDVELHARRSRQKSRQHQQLREVIADIKTLLERIDREIPLLQLAITASGETLSTSLPTNISPSRLLQASALLIVGDTQYTQDSTRSVQIGPAFHLSLYMLFLGHTSPDPHSSSSTKTSAPVYGVGEHDRKPLWQEVAHKVRVRLCRSPPKAQPTKDMRVQQAPALIDSPTPTTGLEYSYHLEVIEDLDDGRVHSEPGPPSAYEDIVRAGFREFIPIYQLAKIFYTDTGRILNLGGDVEGESNPVLLLKRDTGASRPSPTSTTALRCSNSVRSDGDGNAFEDGDEHEHNEQGLEGTPQNTHPGTPTSLPAHLDPEWMAFEVFEADDEPFDETETEAESDSETECKACDKNVAEPERKAGGRKSLDSRVAAQIRSLSLLPSFGRRDSRNDTRRHSEVQSKIGGNASADPSEDALDFVARSPFNAITSSLSLVEMLIRLASLQEFQQASHLSIPDHVLTFFLEESSTTGLSGEASQAKRWEAKRRVGFDPYTDTPAERT